MTMPEASIDKHGDLFAGESEIRLAHDRITPVPTRDPMLMEQGKKDLLR